MKKRILPVILIFLVLAFVSCVKDDGMGRDTDTNAAESGQSENKKTVTEKQPDHTDTDAESSEAGKKDNTETEEKDGTDTKEKEETGIEKKDSTDIKEDDEIEPENKEDTEPVSPIGGGQILPDMPIG